ncbi:tetratricopeptide repeat-containing protein [Bacillaceae bacterium ZC4]|mgnify:FL=1|jgi:tetratricopeptide (TPR) repeat protein|uniref:Uncharacterized protein n=2 Tax=Aeribacillus TaxID=1055323 RepID=A0A161ZV74_9BACI|nr:MULTISPECIES: tetratricopeptide repeat protein [Aeribacillus]AXI40261.1 tetratricopeptide repeat-containing protein [Bacillaceae bacterium ZC4]KZN97207.1 hypothetical protein AZI98_06530 [Aeribacillus pallidus]MDR9795927.1 tetratricopeptide repeat protein [Aeribacillus pallidus]MED0701970.1 tetratricopeptide repeat protein [Aeribacillus composti]MED0714827.1 tetratricopeptide repeat protein [Aeribacillus composti]
MKKANGKIIPFPRLKERLIEKGMNALHNKQFEQALDLFLEARSWNSNHPDIEIGIALCLMELGEYQEAKQICKKMLHEAKGNYFEILQMYLTILVQLGQYDEVKTTIEAVLEENKLPAAHAEQFYKLLHFSRRMSEEQISPEPNDDDLFSRLDKQISYIHSIKNNNNVKKNLHTIEEMLQSKTVHPVVKTMLLQILRDHEIARIMTVEKFGETTAVNPIHLQDLLEMTFAKKVLNLLDDFLGNENPTLFEAVKDIWIRHLYVMYPFHPKPENANIWAAALHYVGYEIFGIVIKLTEVERIYNIKSAEFISVCDKIRQIEEISNIRW